MTRHRVATLGRPGPAWPRAVARWGSGATLPLEATTCVSAEELRALVSGSAVGLAIVEAGLPGVDRVLADEVRRAGTALAVVTTDGLTPAARRLEPDALLPADFDVEALAAVLQAHARSRPSARPVANPAGAPPAHSDLTAVTGPGGTGASTVAQALAAHQARRGPTLLADLALDADQHIRHGVAPGHDGVFELAEALRHAPVETVTPITVLQAPGYELLCGLRRRQEWTVMTGSVADQVVEVLLRSGLPVVADVGADLDGRLESGSLDLEERNGLARAVTRRAATVIVVGRWSTTGVHRLVRTLLDLESHGVERERLQAVVNGAPRRRAGQALAGRALRGLLEDVGHGSWRAPAFLPHDRGVEHCLREAHALPDRLVTRVGERLEPSA